MKATSRWSEAQKTESDFWQGMAKDEHTILQVLASNSAKVAEVRKHLPPATETCLEIGVGPFGLGIIGFLSEIPSRLALDPLEPVPMDPRRGAGANTFDQIRMFVGKSREPIRYLVGSGEEIPLDSESMDVVICCNAIDHASNPDAILTEIYRVLKPGGIFFFDVDTFSFLGLVKWHLWTKYVHKDEILVKAHPHRMYERNVVQRLRASGFLVQKLSGHTFIGNLIGRALPSTYLGSKRGA